MSVEALALVCLLSKGPDYVPYFERCTPPVGARCVVMSRPEWIEQRRTDLQWSQIGNGIACVSFTDNDSRPALKRFYVIQHEPY